MLATFHRFKLRTLLVLAVLLAACTPSSAPQSISTNAKAEPAQVQPSATAVEKIATLIPEDALAPTGTQPVLHAMDEKDQETVTSNLRALLGAPELALTYKGLERSPNATNIAAALFVDVWDNSYYVSQVTLQPIEFTLSHPFPSAQSTVKTAEELRAIAEQYAKDHATKFATWKGKSKYTEGIKGENNFFRWEVPGTDMGGMPAIFQVGLKQDGTLFGYLNSLDFLP